MKYNLDPVQGRGEMFQGNWCKHLSPAKEMSNPINVIWVTDVEESLHKHIYTQECDDDDDDDEDQGG